MPHERLPLPVRPLRPVLNQVSTDSQSRYPHGKTEKKRNPPPPGVHCGTIERCADRGADCRTREDAAVDPERPKAAEKPPLPGCRMLDKKDKRCANLAAHRQPLDEAQ